MTRNNQRLAINVPPRALRDSFNSDPRVVKPNKTLVTQVHRGVSGCAKRLNGRDGRRLCRGRNLTRPPS